MVVGEQTQQHKKPGVFVLEYALPDGGALYLTELLGTGNAALVADVWLAIHFTRFEYAQNYLGHLWKVAPSEVQNIIRAMSIEEYDLENQIHRAAADQRNNG
jgi:murein endopeptidase